MRGAWRNRMIVSKLLVPCRDGPMRFGASQSLDGDRAGGNRGISVVGGACVGVVGIAMGTFVSPVLGLAIVIVFAMPCIVLYLRRRRFPIDSIERDLPALLNSVASSVRAGVDPLRALHDAVAFLPPSSPLTCELARFEKALSIGIDEVEAIEGLFSQQFHPDLDLFKRCLLLSRRHGTSLSEPLHRITRVVRHRQSFRRKTRAALAMHRMSAFGIAMCAVLVAVMQLAVNRSGVRIAIEKPAGMALLCTGGALVAVGVVWMLQMGREERL